MSEIFSLLFSPNSLLAIVTLTFLEIILGIDNIVFLSIITSKVKQADRGKVRTIGLSLALLFRIIMLFFLSFILSLNSTFYSIKSKVFSCDFSVQSIIILLGGIFLIYKSVSEIHEKFEGNEEENTKSNKSIIGAIIQIAILNLVFSFDSILTAIGLVNLENPPVGFGYIVGMAIMIISVILSIIVMLIFAKPVSDFVNNNPTIQILGLSFLILIGVILLAEGSHMANFVFASKIHVESIPKGYLYFTIIFSLAIEFINMKMRKGNDSKRIKLKDNVIKDKELE